MKRLILKLLIIILASKLIILVRIPNYSSPNSSNAQVLTKPLLPISSQPQLPKPLSPISSNAQIFTKPLSPISSDTQLPKPLSPVSSNPTLPKPLSPINSNAPFYPFKTIDLAKEMAILLVNRSGYNDKEFGDIIGVCFSMIQKNVEVYFKKLKNFWKTMGKYYINFSNFKTTSFENNIAFSAVNLSAIGSKNEKINCGQFLSKLNPNPDKAKIYTLLDKEQYFRESKLNNYHYVPYISAIIDTRRKLLPHGAFAMLNRNLKVNLDIRIGTTANKKG